MKALLLSLTFIPLTGCMLHGLHGLHGSGIKGSGKMTTENRSVSGFTKVSQEAAGNIHVTVGPSYSLKLTVDDNLAKHLKTEVKDGELYIKTDKDINPTKLEITLTVPKLEEFKVDGAGDADISGISGESFAGHIDGAGNLVLKGSVRSGKLTIDGAGDINAYELSIESATAEIDGAGDIRVNASGTLNASIDGAGNITYKGGPTVKSKIDGVGSINKG